MTDAQDTGSTQGVIVPREEPDKDTEAAIDAAVEESVAMSASGVKRRRLGGKELEKATEDFYAGKSRAGHHYRVEGNRLVVTKEVQG